MLKKKYKLTPGNCHTKKMRLVDSSLIMFPAEMRFGLVWSEWAAAAAELSRWCAACVERRSAEDQEGAGRGSNTKETARGPHQGLPHCFMVNTSVWCLYNKAIDLSTRLPAIGGHVAQ